MSAFRHDGSEQPVPIFDVLYGYAGPCAFCGFGDKRHRLADALVESHRAGDSVALLVGAYQWPEVVNERSIAALVGYAEANRSRRRHRWAPLPAGHRWAPEPAVPA